MSLVCDCYEEVDEQCLGRYIKAVWQNMSRLKILFHIMVMNTFSIAGFRAIDWLCRLKYRRLKAPIRETTAGNAHCFKDFKTKAKVVVIYSQGFTSALDLAQVRQCSECIRYYIGVKSGIQEE